MTVQVKHKATGNIITEQFVTDVRIANDRYYFTYDRRIRTTMVEKSVPTEFYVIESITE